MVAILCNYGVGERQKQLTAGEPERLLAYNVDEHILGGAQVLIRRLPWPFKALAYVPRGPIAEAEKHHRPARCARTMHVVSTEQQC